MASSLENSLPRTGLPFSTVPKIYDTYLCKELSDKSPAPEVDLLDLDDNRLKVLQSSAAYFSKQDRFRAVERLQLETGRVYMENEEWKYAIRVLRPLWQTLSWRHAGWWHLVEEVGWALWQCARNAGDWETLVAVEWELLSDCMSTPMYAKLPISFCSV